jgi:trehalose 6-phosphate phosphatase
MNVETRDAGAEIRCLAPLQGLRAKDLAFFLDVDGTLLEIAPTPNEVTVEVELIQLLRALLLHSDGAVAFVSGRSIAALDDLFAPLMLPAAGLHGFERRSAAGAYIRRPLPSGVQLFKARVALQALIEPHPGLLLEDKRFALAVHYRQAPQLEPLVVPEVEAIVRSLAPDFEMQRGRCVAEIRPATASKASAVAEFMNEMPFRGRRAVCLGDDLTDEAAFEWVNAAGGLSIAVGVQRASAARAHLGSVRAARMWLRRLIESGE